MFNPSNAQAQAGPDLEEIQTEALGFQAISGDAKLRLLPSPWPSDSLPTPTSTLLSVAPKTGLIAAAGPDTLVIGSTDAVREAFTKAVAAENHVKPFQPQLSIQVPRISQVAFSADENFLTICAAEGGGLAVYDVQKLKSGNTESSFQIATNGVAVRALIPNPAEELGQYVAVVLAKGQLMIADLKQQQFVNGPNGPVLREGVSCISWSARGKQLVAGFGDGSGIQIGPDGSEKAQIPRPPQLDGDQHVSGISWLTNDLFLVIYTPTNVGHGGAPDSTFMLVTREPKTTNFLFQKLHDPCPPFGLPRIPPHHFILRLRQFPPNLNDVLLISSTASEDIGLITSSQTPLASDHAAGRTAGQYTTTTLADDARRAQLPVNDEMNATSPIGVVLDLSSKEPVKRPIPAEEIEASSTPLPALMALNHEGVLSAWWFVYSESVRQGTAFPGLVVAQGQAQQQSQPQQQASPFAAVGQNQSPFGSLGQSSNSTTFGSPTRMGLGTSGAFGASTPLGSNASPWGSGATSGTPQTGGAVFGQQSRFGVGTSQGGASSGFGVAGGLGSRMSPWGSQNQQTPNAGGDKAQNPFSGGGSTASPFANVPSNNAPSGFAALGQQAPQKSIFEQSSQKPAPGLQNEQSVGSTMTIGSSFGSFGAPSTLGSKSPWAQTPALSTNTSNEPFGKPDNGVPQSPEAEMTDTGDQKQPDQKPSGLFGSGTSGFKIASTFKPDNTAKQNEESAPSTGGDWGFGLFNKALQETEKKAESQPQQLQPITPLKSENQDAVANKVPSTTPPSPPKSATQPTVAQPSSEASSGEPPLPPWPPKGKAAAEAEPPLPPSPKPSGGKPIAEPPLPPSPTAKKADTAPEPALPTSPQIKTEPIPEPPLPPSPKPRKATEKDAETAPSPAGSTPVDLGAPEGSSLSSAESLHLDENERTGREIQKPQLEFPSPLPRSQPDAATSKEPDTPSQGTILESPSTITTQPISQTPASATKPPIYFTRPGASQESPRSPSPIRNRRSITGQRSLSSPSPHRMQEQSSSTTPQGAPLPASSTVRQAVKPSFPAPASRLPSVEETVQPSTRTVEELEDEEDARIRDELAQPVEPAKSLAPFLAHQDYVGHIEGHGIPAQIEKVYRDINSMIDTLGLNARSLNAFIKGQSEFIPDGGRERQHLENPDDWCLIEIDDLGIIQKDLIERIDAERPHDVREKLAILQTLFRDVKKLRAQNNDILKLIQPEDARQQQLSASTTKTRDSASLSADQSAVLSDLREAFATFRQQLSAAEEAASMLKAKLAASAALSASTASGSGTAVPTVEAIRNTIKKMTRMAEQKSSDIDVLEAQMRRLGFHRAAEPAHLRSSVLAARPRPRGSRDIDDAMGALSIARENGHGSAYARERDAFSTPPSSSSSRPKDGSAFALVYDEASSAASSEDDDGYDEDEDEERNVARDGSSSPTFTRKSKAKSKSLTLAKEEEAVRIWRARRQRRDKLVELLRQRVSENGINIAQ